MDIMRDSQHEHLVKLLSPYKVSFSKKRYGNPFDGGYIMHPEIAELTDVLYSYGINNDVSFELDFIKLKLIPIRMYDHTIDKLPKEDPLFFWTKEGISGKRDNDKMLGTFDDHVATHGDHDKNIFIKMDIEGDEWQAIPTMLLDQVVGFIIEFHKLDQADISVLEYLNRYFVVTHIHGNNHGDVFSDLKIPKILEVTYISRKLVSDDLLLDYALYPTEYDFPNNPLVPDLELSFVGKNEFTTDWFSIRIPTWWPFVIPHILKETHYLEIGSFEGRSISWMSRLILKHPNSRAYAIDTWEGSVENSESLKKGLMNRFLGSTHDIKDKISIYRGYSSDILKKPEIMNRQYDIIYIDGDHHSWSALEDAVLAFPLLKSGGLMIFDDYLYGEIKTCNSPHLGINAFVSAYKDRIKDLYAGYLVFLHKK